MVSLLRIGTDTNSGIVELTNMSRALNNDTVLALRHADPAAAFETISKALPQLQGQDHGALLEIEILPKSHVLESNTFLLQDENALGISKPALIQAFFVARRMLQDHRSGGGPYLSAEHLLAVTSVILTMDPEHLTAANSRKRLIIAQANEDMQLQIIRLDKFLVDSLLTSRLHRHTKSPTLWSHRRWLIKTAQSLRVQPDVVDDVKRIVMIAGERHPKNYYAWCHARWLTDLIRNDRGKDSVQDLLEATKLWCFRNHTDISGWSFVSFLLLKLEDTVSIDILDETVKLATSLGWTNESTWVFLRTLAATGATDSELASFQESLELLFCRSGSPGNRRVVEQAKKLV